MKKIALIVVIVACGYIGLNRYRPGSGWGIPAVGWESTSGTSSDATFDASRSGRQIEGMGTVIKILSDDNDGSRHQRFILKLGSGQTLLVAHNIDIAPRISDLHVDDSVSFSGQFEWNSKGGVVHWTHHDPRGRHAAGWLMHGNRTYQ